VTALELEPITRLFIVVEANAEVPNTEKFPIMLEVDVVLDMEKDAPL